MPGIVTSEDGFTRQYAGVLSVCVRVLSTNEIVKFLTPDKAEIDFGLKTKAITTSNPLGHKAEANRYLDENMPTAMFKVSSANTKTVALSANRGVAKVANSLENVIIQKQATQPLIAAAPVGGLGNGILIDAATNAAASMNGDPSVPLVQQPWATFVQSTPLSFAMGAGGAIKFSDDLVLDRAYVSLKSIESMDIVQMLFTSLGLCEWIMMFRNSDDTITKIQIPTIAINPEGAKAASDADGTEVKGNISITSGCAGYSIKDFARKVYC
ncbi:hypothetical protein [Chamaesiphon sp. OTE_8_metabat_110]|uniref:hypothetical protein n=1 Tax=Chamaesiphon sp. OTE_8_metabat_110 TaxID=2964696 RepID=UPI00286A1EDF|nr:hypothetical protein [Chamaesiphon sp. OTE_8_metabat_110]